MYESSQNLREAWDKSARQYLLHHVFNQQLRHLYGVQSSALARIVGGQPKVELLLFVNSMAYTTNIDHVLADCVTDRGRIIVVCHQLDAFGLFQCLVDLGQVDRATALYRYTEAIAENTGT